MTANIPFTLRPAIQADFPAIRRLIYDVQINPMGLDWRRFIMAVDAEDQLVGCGQVKTHKDGSLELASIAVMPEWRKQGVARRIILHMLETHQRPLYLTCRGKLGAFYEKFGFQVVTAPAELPPYFRRVTRLVKVLQRLGFTHERMLVMKLDR
jgi:N-acetylglutamate synthase-like GNAT family acetyltransferase